MPTCGGRKTYILFLREECANPAAVVDARTQLHGAVGRLVGPAVLQNAVSAYQKLSDCGRKDILTCCRAVLEASLSAVRNYVMDQCISFRKVNSFFRGEECAD